MEYEFHLQDPTSTGTVYLLEAILQASHGASSFSGMFAFASRAGVDSLIQDPETQEFLKDSSISLLVGIDAVTNRQALERLQELEGEHEKLSVQVFWNPTSALFHPKVSRFEYPDGSRSLIVGSGNLTPGGLRKHFEAFSVVHSSPSEALNLSSWDSFLDVHEANIRPIDEEALERASQNIIRRGRRGAAVQPDPLPANDVAATEVPAIGTERFLLAQVPEAGRRWQQLHLNKAVVEEFFRVKPNSPQRAYLIECRQDGSFAEQEVRPCVYSQSNKNHKIEIGSHKGVEYPASGLPIAIFYELQVRSFAYMLLMPGEPGYSEMSALNTSLASVGRGVHRTITDSQAVLAAWPDMPIFKAIEDLIEHGD